MQRFVLLLPGGRHRALAMAGHLSCKAEAARAATVVEDAEDDVVAAVPDNGRGMKDVARPVDVSSAAEPFVLDDAGA